jgi:hypothetical protein
MKPADCIADWFGDEGYMANLERIRAFWDGKERFLVSVHPEEDGYRQMFDDARMLALAPRHLQRTARLPGVNLPAFIADFGTVSTGRYWGGRTRFDSTGKNLFIDPVAHSAENALYLRPRPVDDQDMDAAHALRLFGRLSEILGTDRLWLRTPDMQGALNTAAFIVNEAELLVSLYNRQDLTRLLLGRVTDFLIEYAMYLKNGTGNRLCGNIWPYVFVPSDLGLGVTEDMMPLLSPDLYEEFGIPYLKRIADSLGGLVVHCCGEWGRHVPALKRSGIRLLAAEYYHPFTRIEELEGLAEGTAFVPNIMLEKQDAFSSVSQYYRHLLDETPDGFRYWFIFPSDTEEALRFAKDYGF